jgi:predicted Zn-dependent peptidase
MRLSELFFEDKNLSTPSISTVELMEHETRQSVLSTIKMLLTDTIDIWILGDLSAAQEASVRTYFSDAFTDREPLSTVFYEQETANIVREKTEKEAVNQSILQLAYSHPVKWRFGLSRCKC